MKILRREDYRKMPWKNGGGLTEEVMTSPPGADMAGFDWRLSIAHVEVDGPFSRFPGIDRTIALLDGNGLWLDLPDLTIDLDARGEPFAFSGDLDISSRNKSGPTVDLNIMTRRGPISHRMRRLRTNGLLITRPIALVVLNEAATIDVGGTEATLSRFDTILFEQQDVELRLDHQAEILVIEIDAPQP